MHIPKTRRGGAYIMVITAIMLILLLVTVALGVTTASRRITARYAYTVGLYDLAVSGNEQALIFLRQRFDDYYRESVNSRAWEQIVHGGPVGFVLSDEGLRLDENTAARFKQFFVADAMSYFDSFIRNTFSQVEVRRFRPLRIYFYNRWRDWTFNTTVDIRDQEHEIISVYNVSTFFRPALTAADRPALRPDNDRIYTRTTINKIINNASASHTAIVSASIIWRASGHREITLDAYTIDTLEAHGAIFPTPPLSEMIIILDDFALTMVESLRLDESR